MAGVRTWPPWPQRRSHSQCSWKNVHVKWTHMTCNDVNYLFQKRQIMATYDYFYYSTKIHYAAQCVVRDGITHVTQVVYWWLYNAQISGGNLVYLAINGNTYSELTSLGVIRGTYVEPTQMMDSLEQLQDGGHFTAFLPVCPDGSKHSSTVDAITA